MITLLKCQCNILLFSKLYNRKLRLAVTVLLLIRRTFDLFNFLINLVTVLNTSTIVIIYLKVYIRPHFENEKRHSSVQKEKQNLAF